MLSHHEISLLAIQSHARRPLEKILFLPMFGTFLILWALLSLHRVKAFILLGAVVGSIWALTLALISIPATRQLCRYIASSDHISNATERGSILRPALLLFVTSKIITALTVIGPIWNWYAQQIKHQVKRE